MADGPTDTPPPTGPAGNPPPPGGNPMSNQNLTGQWAIDKFLEEHPVLRKWLVHIICFCAGCAAVYFMFAFVVIPGKQNLIEYLEKKVDDTKNYTDVVGERDRLRGVSNGLAIGNGHLVDALGQEMGSNAAIHLELQGVESNTSILADDLAMFRDQTVCLG
jgi:hypothetical protein